MPEIYLDTDEVDLVIGGDAQRLPCEVVLRTDPRPRVLLKVSGLDQWERFRAAHGAGTRYSIHLVNARVDCDMFVTGAGDDVLEFSPFTEPITVGSSGDLACVRFDVVNFPSFHVLYGASASKERDRLDIAAGGWSIEIRSPRQSPALAAFQSPLYSVTQSGTMRRSNGAAFNPDAAQQLLGVLQEAFSFAAGRWVAPVFVEGVTGSGEIVWKVWGTGKLHPGPSAEGTWFDLHHGDALADVVSGLLDLRRSAEQVEAFRIALYWYIRSGTDAAGVDGGLILLQAALERLWWQRLVIDRAMSSGKRSVGKLSAHERLRLLIEDCGIPKLVPTGLTDLAAEAMRRGWDGPSSVASARNLLVHPEGLRPLPWYDLWRLARWYVELVLLRMIGFAGEYSNCTVQRRWVGAVDRVPWA